MRAALWAGSLQAGVAHSGTEHTLRTGVQGVVQSVCEQHSAAITVKVPVVETVLYQSLILNYWLFSLT